MLGGDDGKIYRVKTLQLLHATRKRIKLKIRVLKLSEHVSFQLLPQCNFMLVQCVLHINFVDCC